MSIEFVLLCLNTTWARDLMVSAGDHMMIGLGFTIASIDKAELEILKRRQSFHQPVVVVEEIPAQTLMICVENPATLVDALRNSHRRRGERTPGAPTALLLVNLFPSHSAANEATTIQNPILKLARLLLVGNKILSLRLLYK